MALSDDEFLLIEGMIVNGMAITVHAIRTIERRLADNPNDPEFLTLTRKKAELGGALELLRERQGALQRQRAQLTPPSKPQVDRIVALSDEVQELQRHQETASLLLNIAGKTVDIANQVADVADNKKPANKKPT